MDACDSPMDPLGQLTAAGRPNLVLGHQMVASKALGQPSYTTGEEKKKTTSQDNYYRPDGEDSCYPCDCFPIGSESRTCDPRSGQCPCKGGVIGRQCNRCDNPFAEVTVTGCEDGRTGRCMDACDSPMDPLGQLTAAGRPNLVLGHQMVASKALGQPSYTTGEEKKKTTSQGHRRQVCVLQSSMQWLFSGQMLESQGSARSQPSSTRIFSPCAMLTLSTWCHSPSLTRTFVKTSDATISFLNHTSRRTC
ncbi:hypothetical protein CRUP_014409 [Coryphaenoides rupestris]|nr:hypothetical protein CRUP_014409 [Coryphaenoides rupestris]